VASLGGTTDCNSCRLVAFARTPFGRGKIRMQWEVKPLGTLFNGTGLGNGSYTDIGTAGLTFNQVVAGLSRNTVYHWRLRFQYNPTGVPFMPHSRWVSMPDNGWQETDLRTCRCGPPFAPADFDQDCDVDEDDLEIFEGCASGPSISLAPGCEYTDMDVDGSTDMMDFGIFQRCWSGRTTPPTRTAQTDINGDGIVDMEDFAGLQRRISVGAAVADPRCAD